MKVTLKEQREVITTFAKDMPVGTLGRIADGALPEVQGNLVLRIYSGLICLSNPSISWNLKSCEYIGVEILPDGSVIELVQSL